MNVSYSILCSLYDRGSSNLIPHLTAREAKHDKLFSNKQEKNKHI